MKKIILLATGGTIACVPGADGLAPGVTIPAISSRRNGACWPGRPGTR